MTTFIAKIKQGLPEFGDYNGPLFRDWCRKNEGKNIRIEPVKAPVSNNLRAYYFAAVIPVIRRTCKDWENLTADQIHEIVKKMFFYFETMNPKTGRIERFGRSVMAENEWNNTQKAMQFLDIIHQYLIDCGEEMPDSEEYKRFINSAPLK